MRSVFAAGFSLSNPSIRPALARLAMAALLLSMPAIHAQFGAPETTPVHDASALRPPAGARVAIVEFDDMECPECGHINPLLVQAAQKYHLPWIRHDFPLPYHAWSFQAAVNARYFDTISEALGNEYRNYIFANQISIETQPQLSVWTRSFASAHKIALPFAIDPMGRLAQLVKNDRDLGNRIGINHTPTIWIVANAPHVAPYVEVADPNKLFQVIDQVMAQVRSAK